MGNEKIPDFLDFVVWFYGYYEKLDTKEKMENLHDRICEASEQAKDDTIAEIWGDD